MSKKPDEIALYAALRERARIGVSPWAMPRCPGMEAVEAEIARLGIHPKRAYGLIEKWTLRGWWEYGVSLRTGWFTREAPECLSDPSPGEGGRR
jgi:hypothetical protein